MVATSSGAPEPVWVGARIRPLSQAEKKRGEAQSWQVTNSRTLKLADKSERFGLSHSSATYTYDTAFGPESKSEEVYMKAARERVLSAMRGLNASLFVYGQTGSGKTYTMNQIVRHSAAEIFQSIEQTPSREFLLKLTAVEIYNEKVRDLLTEGGDRQNLSLIDDPERGVVPENCTDIGLESSSQLGDLLKRIEARRTVRDTRMNAESSRSHQIIRIYIESRPARDSEGGSAEFGGEDLRPVNVSTINFVDLAGSERGSASGLESPLERIRQSEGSAINKSLLTLGNVIRSLGDSKVKSHVPFRDSKLTRMLQPSLGGNSRTAIVCTLSPARSAVEISKAALHFANAAKRVTVQPRVNEVLSERARIRRLQSEIDALHEQLETRDFAEEAAQLSAALRQKEQEFKLTAEERDQMHKRLQNLERLILRSETPSKDKRRMSWSEMPRSGQVQPGSERQARPLHMSWASPSSSSTATPPGEEPAGHISALHRQAVTRQSDRLLLDCFIPPAVRQKATPRGGGDTGRSESQEPELSRRSVQGAQESTREQLQKMEELQAPVGDDERAALEALKAEVRCIGRRGSFKEQTSTTMSRLRTELNRLQEQIGRDHGAGEQEETVAALQAEVARLEAAQSVQRAADSALDSLQDKIAVLKLSTESQEKQDSREKLSGMPSWFSFGSADEDLPGIQEAESGMATRNSGLLSSQESAEGDGPLLGSPSGSPQRGGVLRSFAKATRERPGFDQTPRELASTADSYRPSSRGLRSTLEQASAANPQWYKAQLRRMQSKFREAAAEDVGELRTALEQQRDQAARLECQKQLLLKQVLRIELRLDESEKARAQLEEELTAAREEGRSPPAGGADGGTRATSSDGSEAAAAEPPRGRYEALQASPAGPPMPGIAAAWRGSPPKVPLLRLQGDVPPHMLDSSDSWTGPPSTIEGMLPKIVELWAALHVPLIHRSRFYLAFRGRETFYFEAEKRRLAWLQTEIGDPEDRNPVKAQKAKRALARSARKLDWEQKWLAQQVKWDFTPEEREEMFLAWNIHRDSKQRKLQLIKRLWSPETLRDADGKERSSELVMRLNGAEATDGMFDLVFGRNQGDSAVKTMLATGGSMLAKIATPLRASTPASPAPAVVPRRRSFLSSIAQTLTPRGRSSTTPAADIGTPLRHGSMAWTPSATPRGA